MFYNFEKYDKLTLILVFLLSTMYVYYITMMNSPCRPTAAQYGTGKNRPISDSHGLFLMPNISF